MKSRIFRGAVVALVLGVAGTIFLLPRHGGLPPAPTVSPPSLPAPTGGRLPAPAPTVAPPILTPDRAQPAGVAPEGVRVLPGANDRVRELNGADQPPEHDLEILDEVLSEYRRVFGQNPPGGLNAEITAALRGANPRRLAVLPPDLGALNTSGELVDRWNTPYYFHPVSRTVMEVLSAGPDQQLWTSDDIGTLTPAGTETREDF